MIDDAMSSEQRQLRYGLEDLVAELAYVAPLITLPRSTNGDRADVQELVSALIVIHSKQWDLEDLCRAPGISDLELGRLKRAIDQSNADRISCINAIDDVTSLESPMVGCDTQIIWPLTVGQSLDVISIAALKAKRTQSAQAVEAYMHACASIRTLATLIEAGSVKLPPSSTKKYYSSANYGPTLRKV